VGWMNGVPTDGLLSVGWMNGVPTDGLLSVGWMDGVISPADLSEALAVATAFGVSSRTASSGEGEDGEAAADWVSTGCTVPYRLP